VVVCWVLSDGQRGELLLNNRITESVFGVHAFRGSAISIVGTVGDTRVNTNLPTMPARDLAADFLTLYGLDISSLTGGPPPPSPPAVDMCPNLPGDQATVPAGYMVTDGQCVVPPVTKPLCSAIPNPLTRFFAYVTGRCVR